MTIFRLKQLASTSVHAAADIVRWNYDRAELIADGVVHAIGVCFGLIAATVLIVLTAVYATAVDVAVVSVYVAGLLAMLVLSATYNLWPVFRAKWVLRRFDHSAIYLLIAATYTPFAANRLSAGTGAVMLAAIWLCATIGVILKMMFPRRFERLSIAFYLAMGWMILAVSKPLSAQLATTDLWLLLAGGIVYSVGVVFFLAERLPFHKPVWHGFVLAAIMLHFAAIVGEFAR